VLHSLEFHTLRTSNLVNLLPLLGRNLWWLAICSKLCYQALDLYESHFFWPFLLSLSKYPSLWTFFKSKCILANYWICCKLGCLKCTIRRNKLNFMIRRLLLISSSWGDWRAWLFLFSLWLLICHFTVSK
jgi:hypothetical protein